MLNEYYYIDQIRVSVTDIKKVVENIVSESRGKARYVCIANVRTVVYGNRDTKYGKVINNAFLNLPDGMPIVWAGKLSGAKSIRRTTGPDLFIELTKSKYKLRHYLLGDTEEVLNNLVIKIKTSEPSTIISGIYSPPFASIENLDIENIARRINQTDSQIIWVALGSPKQDFFAAQLVSHLNSGIVIGVGAAFRFYLGEYKHPPRFFQIIGMEGIFWRFFKNPFTEFKWYLYHVPRYIRLLTKLKYHH